MTVKNLYIIMAREVTTDEADNLTSIIKVVDSFGFTLEPDQLAEKTHNLPATFAVATSWLFDEKLKEDTSYKFRLDIIDPFGKKMDNGAEKENSLPAGINKFNMNFNIQGLAATTQGSYKLQAEILTKDGESLAKTEYPFEVAFNTN